MPCITASVEAGDAGAESSTRIAVPVFGPGSFACTQVDTGESVVYNRTMTTDKTLALPYPAVGARNKAKAPTFFPSLIDIGDSDTGLSYRFFATGFTGYRVSVEVVTPDGSTIRCGALVGDPLSGRVDSYVFNTEAGERTHLGSFGDYQSAFEELDETVVASITEMDDQI